MADPKIEGALGRPFTEQVAFFRRKLGNLVPTEQWTDMQGAAHDDGFMVAGATKADLLADFAAAVDQAITEGRGIEEFRKDFRSIVARHGWTGWAGEGSVKGEAWRVKTILSTNSYTSYAAGRMAQLRAGDWPWWVYLHGGSQHPRKHHLSWNGTPLPPDHRFWLTHYPPSDWNCSCYVVGARSAAGIRRVGGDPDKKLPGGWDKIDVSTGAPVGIGKGWNYAPGASVSHLVQAMAAKVGAWDHQIAKAFMADLPAERADQLADAYRALPSTAADLRSYAQRVLEPQPEQPKLPPVRTVGMIRSDQIGEIDKLTGVNVTGYDFSIDVSGVGHVMRDHGNDAAERTRGQRGVTPADFALLPRILSDPDSMTLGGTSDMGEQLITFRKVVNGEVVNVEMAVRGKKRRTLSLKTMFVRLPGKGQRIPKPTP